MTNHLEVPFDNNGVVTSATIQLDRNEAYITVEGGRTMHIETRYVEQFVSKWNEIKQRNF